MVRVPVLEDVEEIDSYKIFIPFNIKRLFSNYLLIEK